MPETKQKRPAQSHLSHPAGYQPLSSKNAIVRLFLPGTLAASAGKAPLKASIAGIRKVDSIDRNIGAGGFPIMLTRRSFLITSGLTALASTRVVGANDRLRLGVIGAGHRMKLLLDCADKAGACQIVSMGPTVTRSKSVPAVWQPHTWTTAKSWSRMSTL